MLLNPILRGFNLNTISQNAKESILRKNNLLSTIDKNDDNYDQKVSKLFSVCSANGILNSKGVESWLAGADNVCTDGEDDGKIGFFSKVGNFFDGIAKTAVGSIKSILSDPKKAIALTMGIAVSAALVAVLGPVGIALASVVGLSAAAKLIIQGGKDFVEASKQAENAKTDSEAKAAYEQMGSGTFKVGVGVYCGIQSGTGLVSACKRIVAPLKSAANSPEGTTVISDLSDLEGDTMKVFTEEFNNGFLDPSLLTDD